MYASVNEFCRDESGATAIEYGLIAALVSVAAIAALEQMGTSLVTIFDTVSSKLEGAAAGTATPPPPPPP